MTAMNKMYNDSGLMPSHLVRMNQDKRNFNDKNGKDNQKSGKVALIAGRDSPRSDNEDLVNVEPSSVKN